MHAVPDSESHHSSASSSVRPRLLQIVRELSLQRGRFVLSSGVVSDHYLDLRRTTTDPEGALLSARLLLQEAARLEVQYVGGPTLGADPLVGAAVALSYGAGQPVRGFLVRETAKSHGTGRQIEGHLQARGQVLVLDDVVTSAGSIARAIQVVREAGAEVAGAWCLVDRGAGGRERLEAMGVTLTAVFHLQEVLTATEPTSSRAESLSAFEREPFHPRTPYATADAILELVPGHVLLVRRKNPPYGWSLPGGFVEVGESLEQAVRREIAEETGLDIERAHQLHTYSEPGRDPRFHTVTTVFVARAVGEPQAGDDAAQVRLFPLDDLPADLCFDHRAVLEDFCAGRHGIGPGQLH